MKDNCYAYAIDLSLRKGKNLVGGSKWSYKSAFAKAFPDTNITINIE